MLLAKSYYDKWLLYLYSFLLANKMNTFINLLRKRSQIRYLIFYDILPKSVSVIKCIRLVKKKYKKKSKRERKKKSECN